MTESISIFSTGLGINKRGKQINPLSFCVQNEKLVNPIVSAFIIWKINNKTRREKGSRHAEDQLIFSCIGLNKKLKSH